MRPLSLAAAFLTAAALTIGGPPGATSGGAASLRIVSVNLSHRIVLLDAVETRLKLIVGFVVEGALPGGPAGTAARGILVAQGSAVSVVSLPKLDSLGGNLVFYLPYGVRPGPYEVRVELTDVRSGGAVGAGRYTIPQIERVTARSGGTGYDWMRSLDVPLRDPAREALRARPTKADRARGYLLWHRNPFCYVYPGSAPTEGEVLAAVSARLARDEYEPATFSLYALGDLDVVSVAASPLKGPGGASLPAPEVRAVARVARMKTSAGDAYEMRPRLLKRDASAAVAAGDSQRFWLTVHAPATARPGRYRGQVAIATRFGKQRIPLHVEVLPFRLVSRPDKQYGFDMTYEFQEMTATDLSERERQLVYENGLKYYRSYREHGLTTVIAHSPFAFQRIPDGQPDLRDLQAALRAFTEVGFTGPFIYYCGHLVQTAKPGWAGSTLGYDSNRHPQLMREIVAFSRAHFPEMGRTDVYWMPGDEVQDAAGGADRMKIAREVLSALWAAREKTAIAVWEKTDWPVDITLGGPEPAHGQHWQYPNEQTTTPSRVDDPESMRRAFGLAHVRSRYVGIAPWTFQTAENASGDPFSDVDTQKGSPEVMVAYPGTDGPALTPEYEAVREGIDDGKYAYQLELRLKQAKRSGDDGRRSLAGRIEVAYEGMLRGAAKATLAQMDSNRAALVRWILELDRGVGTRTRSGTGQRGSSSRR